MEISSVASQLQSQLIQQTKPQGSKPTVPTPAPIRTDADGDRDGDTSASDKGNGVDTKG